MNAPGYDTPCCPVCGDHRVYRLMCSVEKEQLVTLTLDGDVFDARCVEVIESERLGLMRCGNQHTFERPARMEDSENDMIETGVAARHPQLLARVEAKWNA